MHVPCTLSVRNLVACHIWLCCSTLHIIVPYCMLSTVLTPLACFLPRKVVEAPYPVTKDPYPFWMASKWLSMNTLMLDPQRVVVSKDEIPTQEMFQKLGIKCIKVWLFI